MSNLELIQPTDQILNRPVERITQNELHTPEIQAIINRMLELAAGKGHSKHDSRQMVGLAAPQLGVAKQIIIMDVTADGFNKPQTLQVIVNPAITAHSDQTVPGREGCWSTSNICGVVQRFTTVTVEGLDRDGQPLILKLSDFPARIAQHETDHMQGIRFPDRIPSDKPELLHWVEPAEFQNYREQWMHWKTLCPRATWEKLKQGEAFS